jgi:hypothetical protein
MNSPLNEIFESLTSLKEELTSQNKENFKQKNLEKIKQFLLEKQLLDEKDNRQFIVNKLGLSQEVADFSHKISEKYSLWIANVIKNNFPNGYNILENEFKNVIEMFKDENKPVLDIKNLNWSDAEDYYNLYTYIKDWRDSPDVPSVNLRNMSWQEAERLSTEWHESLGGGKSVSDILDEKDKIIYKFSNGFYWVLRESNTCEKSRESMGHCATASSSDMYLFRLIKNDEEFITADWHPTDRYIIQIKGKANTKPKKEYYPYIMWLITDSGYIDDLRTDKGFRPETNFHFEDLDEKQIDYVTNKNFKLFANSITKLGKSKDKNDQKLFYSMLIKNSDKLLSNMSNQSFTKLIADSPNSFKTTENLIKINKKAFIEKIDYDNIYKIIDEIIYDWDYIFSRNVSGVNRYKLNNPIRTTVTKKYIDLLISKGGKDFLLKAINNDTFYNLTSLYVNKLNKKDLKSGVIKFSENILKYGGKEVANAIIKEKKMKILTNILFKLGDNLGPFILKLFDYIDLYNLKSNDLRDIYLTIASAHTDKKSPFILNLKIAEKIIQKGGKEYFNSIGVYSMKDFFIDVYFGTAYLTKENKIIFYNLFKKYNIFQEEDEYRLTESALLTEKDNRKIIIDKLGLSQEIADWAHGLSDKYSLWIANQIKRLLESNPGLKRDIDLYILEQQRHGFTQGNNPFARYGLTIINAIKMFKDDNKPPLDIKNLNLNDAENYSNIYTYITDWRDNPNTPTLNLRNMSWEQAENLSREWHESLKTIGKVSYILDEKDEIIHEFNDGFYWVLRKDSYCSKSEESMGHCASATYNNMYLFRLIKNDEEFITVDYSPSYKYVIQIKGKKNSKPKEEYYPYIIWLIADSGYIDELRTDMGYKPESNFHLEDLNDEQIIYVSIKNPKLKTIEKILANSSDPEKIFNLLGDKGKEFIMKLDENNIRNLLKISSNPDKVIEGLINVGGKEFIMKLDSYHNYFILLLYSKEPDKVIEGLINVGGEEFIDELNDSKIYELFKYSSDPEKILNLLGDKGREYMLNNFDTYDIQFVKNPTKIMNILLNIRGKEFIENLSFNDIGNILYFSLEPERIFNLLSKDKRKEFLMSLKDYHIENLSTSSLNPEQIKQILQQYGKLPKEEPKTPMNEIFNSLTSLQEELNEQRKVNVKQKNLEKVKQFLLEKKNLLNEISVQDAYNKFYKDIISQEDFNEIVKADPLSKPNFLSPYSKWMIKRYKEEHIKLEDLPAFTEYLTTYNRYKDNYKNVDWNQLKTKDDLFNIVKDDLAYSKAKTGNVNLCEPIDGSEKIYEDENWCVIIPDTEYAACYYGRNTEWCTTWGEKSFDERHKGKTNRFDGHNNQGPLYIIINKNNQSEKYQFHFETTQFMDVRDKQLDKNSEIFKKLIINIFSKDEVFDKLTENGKKIISNIYKKGFDFQNILRDSSNPDEFIDSLFNSDNKSFIKLLSTDDMYTLLFYSSKPEKIIKILGKKGIKYLMNLSVYGISHLLQFSKNTIGIINMLSNFGGKEYIMKLDSNNIHTLLKYSKQEKRDIIIDWFLSFGGKEFIMNLDFDAIHYFFMYSSFENNYSLKKIFEKYGRNEEVKEILKKYSIRLEDGRSISTYDYFNSLKDELNEENIKQKNLEKVKQFLLEKKNLLNEISIQDAYNKFYKEKVSEEDFNEIVKADSFSKPNFLSPYAKWMITRYIQNHIKLEDLPAFTEYIQTYQRYKDNYKNVDWNQLKTKDDLFNIVKDDLAYSRAKVGSVNLCEPIDGAEKFYEDDKWCIIIPKTEYSACYYGRNTEWCTAWGEKSFDERHKGKTSRFEGHNNQGPLYVIINKNNQNEKYQFHFESNQFKGVNDKEIGKNSTVFKELINIFSKDEILNKLTVLTKNKVLSLNGNIAEYILKGDKDFIMGLNLNNDDIIYYIFNFSKKSNHDKIIDTILSVGGKEFIINLDNRTILALINKSSQKNIDKIVIKLFSIGGEELIKNIDTYTIRNIVLARPNQKRDNIIKYLFDVYMNYLDVDIIKYLFDNLSVETKKSEYFEKLVSKLFNKRHIIKNLTNSMISTIFEYINNPLHYYKMIDIDRIDDFFMQWPGTFFKGYVKNPEELSIILKKHGKKFDSPLNEIFNSLTSLQEELTEQRKISVKESNLMKVQNFIKMKKNNQ